MALGVAKNYEETRRMIRLVESNAKCRYLKKLTRKGTLRQVFYLSRGPSPPMTPYAPPPLHTVYVYSLYLFIQGRVGRANQREGAIVHIVGSKIPA
jgi:hypothetical protein